MIVKRYLVLSLSLLLAGCATRSTVETRKREHPADYAALSPDMQKFVDQGRIKVGMSPEAVYLAWGKPAQVLHQENEAGAITIWLYEGGYMEENRYWYYRQLAYDYQPRVYVRAEIVFAEDKVVEWRTLPQPVN